MLKFVCVTLIIYSYLNYGLAKEVYEENADDLFKAVLGEIYKVTHNFLIPTKYTTDIKMKKSNSIHEYYDYNILKSETPHITTTNTTLNTAKEYLKTKKLDKVIDELLKRKDNPIPDFHKDIDEIELITRRFDAIRVISNMTRKYLRNREELKGYAASVKNIMLQFIYETRYRLSYAQLLREKYKEQTRYKLGYCFALLRNLKQQQLVLYSSLKKYTESDSLYYSIKIYEKVVRLDVDIKDLVKFIKKLEYDRKMVENPTYYDDFPEKKPGGKLHAAGPRRFGPGIIQPILNGGLRSRALGESVFEGGKNPQFGSVRSVGWEPRGLDFGGLGRLRLKNSKNVGLGPGDQESEALSPGRLNLANANGPISGQRSSESPSGLKTPVPGSTSKRSLYSQLWFPGFGT